MIVHYLITQSSFALNTTAQHVVSTSGVPACCYTFHFELRCVTVLSRLAALLATHAPIRGCFLALLPLT